MNSWAEFSWISKDGVLVNIPVGPSIWTLMSAPRRQDWSPTFIRQTHISPPPVASVALRLVTLVSGWHLASSRLWFVWHFELGLSRILFWYFSSPPGHRWSDCLAGIWCGQRSWYLTFLPTGSLPAFSGCPRITPLNLPLAGVLLDV